MKASECKYEVWKPIHNFNNYEVSTFGRIRSIPRKVHTWYGERKVKGKILNTRLNKGYLYVLMRDNNNKVRNMKVHDLQKRYEELVSRTQKKGFFAKLFGL